MSVHCVYECSGCFAKAEGRTMERHFDSFNGKGYGFGVYRYDTAQDAAPDGWMAYDPHTGCTYCPACVNEVFGEQEAAT